jgi:hypothetical protein
LPQNFISIHVFLLGDFAITSIEFSKDWLAQDSKLQKDTYAYKPQLYTLAQMAVPLFQ